MNIKRFFMISALITMSFSTIEMYAYTYICAPPPQQHIQPRMSAEEARIREYFRTLRAKIKKECSVAEIEDWSSTRATPPLADWLVIQKQNELLRQLLDRGLSPQTNTDPKDLPIRRAVSSGNEVASKLLLDHGAFITEIDSNGSTLLMETVSRLYKSNYTYRGCRYQFDVMETLHQILGHKNGVQLINRKNNDGKSALGLAIDGLSEAISKETKLSFHIVDLLVQHGENPSLAMQNAEVVTAIEKLEKAGYKNFVFHIREQYEQFKARHAERLGSHLMEEGPMKGQKIDAECTYGPFPCDLAQLIARHRFNCEDSPRS